MFENILKEFKRLSMAVDFLTEDQATDIIGTVTRKVMEYMGAYTVDVLWRKEKIRDGIYLRALWSESKSRRGSAKGHFVNPESHGIWSKVYREHKPVWIEGIQSKECERSITAGGTDENLEERYIRLTDPIKNQIGGRSIEPSDLEFYEDTDTIIAIPISYRDTIWGVYSIQLDKFQKKVEDKAFKEISDLVYEMAHLMWKSDVQKQYIDDTKRAITNFQDAIVTPPVTITLNRERKGFIARPFVGEDFQYVEDYINEYLHVKGIHVDHYSYSPGGGIIIENLMEKIKQAHFGIADITENRPNSLLELGMMMILDKKFIILKRKDDDKEVPFDISAYQYYRYEKEGVKFVFFEPGNNNPLNIDDIFDSFIRILEQNKNFIEAKPYTAG